MLALVLVLGMRFEPGNTVKLSRIIKEPLLHFLIIGALLFVLYSVVGQSSSGLSDQIEITTADVQRLSAGWEREHGRPPEPSELDAMIDEEIRLEVFYREALSLGLDRGDTVIRKRLAEKMEFFVEDEAASTSTRGDAATARRQALFEELSKKYVIVRPNKPAAGQP